MPRDPQPTPVDDNTRVSTTSTLSPETIKKVAERVYAMLLQDLRVEQERQGRSSSHLRRPRGGW